jgi:Tfp pilus assembly protein PilF
MNDHTIDAATGDTDSTRWMQQAIAAQQAGDADAAFDFLKRSIASAQPSPLALHLAAAEFAQRGDPGNAVVCFTRALERSPGMDVARLQLALLWLLQDSPSAAAATLQPLLSAAPTSAVALFATALDALARGQAPIAIDALDRGLATSCDNPALLEDMRVLRARLGAASPAGATDAGLVTMRHGLAVGAYAGSKDPAS